VLNADGNVETVGKENDGPIPIQASNLSSPEVFLMEK